MSENWIFGGNEVSWPCFLLSYGYIISFLDPWGQRIHIKSFSGIPNSIWMIRMIKNVWKLDIWRKWDVLTMFLSSYMGLSYTASTLNHFQAFLTPSGWSRMSKTGLLEEIGCLDYVSCSYMGIYFLDSFWPRKPHFFHTFLTPSGWSRMSKTGSLEEIRYLNNAFILLYGHIISFWNHFGQGIHTSIFLTFLILYRRSG